MILTSCVQESNPILFYSNKLKSSIDSKTLKGLVKIDEKDIRIRKFYIDQKPVALNLINSHDDLKLHLDSVKIFKENSRSYLLLNIIYKKMNKEKFKLDSLVSEVRIWEEEVIKGQDIRRKCKDDQKENAKYNITNFEKGDIVNMDIPIDERDNVKNAVYFECPKSYETCTNDFLIIKLLILDKKYFREVDYKSKMIMTKVLSMSRDDVPILYEWYNIKDTFLIDFNTYHGRLY